MPKVFNMNSKNSFITNTKSKSNKSSYIIIFILILCAGAFAAYYFAYKSNREPFSSKNNNSKSGAPKIKASKGETVVALFYADWCPHCVAFKPDFKKAMSNLSGNTYKDKELRFVLVDCVENKTIASENGVSGFPTVKIFTDDNKSSEYSGERSYEGLATYFS